jgi:phage terminase large subunit
MLEFGAKRQFFDRLRECGVVYDQNKQTGVVTIPRTGAEVRFATLETSSRVRGPNYAWGWVDELDYLTDEELWQALKGAIRDGDQPQLFATSTPKGRRLIWREWVERATAEHALYRASTLDNPYIDGDRYVAALGYAGRYYRQEIEAQFEGAEGLVYADFDRTRHVKPITTYDWGGVIGVDAGVRNPSAILTVRHVGDARHLEHEIYRAGMGNAELLVAVRSAADRLGALLTSIEVDPSAAGLITDLRALGYPVHLANNAILDGIREVTTALAHGFTVDPSCQDTIAEFESYAYPDNRQHADKPVDANNHAMDALRYALMHWVGRPTVSASSWMGPADDD